MPKAEFKYYAYIMGSKSGTLYTGVTNNIYRRTLEHRSGASGFTAKYGCKHLVYYEVFHRVVAAIAREKAIKNMSRAAKIALIEAENPKWLDLAESWGKPQEAPAWQVRTVEGLRPKAGPAETLQPAGIPRAQKKGRSE
jgi:putative endonuclease